MSTIKNGIGFGNSKNVAFLDLSGYPNSSAKAASSTDTSAPKAEKLSKDELTGTPWAPWGKDNLLPHHMTCDIEECGVLNAGIDGKARFGLGYGPKPFFVKGWEPDKGELLEPCLDPEVLDWAEENDLMDSSLGWFKDSIGMGNDVARFKFTNNGEKLGLCWRHDVTEMRLEKQDDNGIINNAYFCAEWENIAAYDPKDKRIIKIEMLPRIGPAAKLLQLTPDQRKGREFALAGRIPSWGRHYYSMALWYSAKMWVDIAKGVPEMKAAMFNNNIRLKYVVTIYDGYWELAFGKADWNKYTAAEKEQKRNEVYDSIDEYLTGGKNAYKSIFVPGNWDPISKTATPLIEIKPIEDSTKQGELLPDSAAANSEILFALMMNPALMGADMPGGPYSGGAGSGSNIREAALVQVMIQELERQKISRYLNIVKKVNGWDDKIVWRFPGLVLTTLDKGKSTETKTN